MRSGANKSIGERKISTNYEKEIAWIKMDNYCLYVGLQSNFDSQDLSWPQLKPLDKPSWGLFSNLGQKLVAGSSKTVDALKRPFKFKFRVRCFKR